MKLNFNIPLTDLSGKEITEGDKKIMLGQLLANTLASQTKGDALKLFSWAIDLHAGKILDLDKSDQKTLNDFIITNDQITILGKGQLLAVFETK
jgi:hypothetical protein